MCPHGATQATLSRSLRAKVSRIEPVSLPRTKGNINVRGMAEQLASRKLEAMRRPLEELANALKKAVA
jgi:hypothetical protein